jgi:thiamine biosynthesis lipoprotein
LNPKRINSLALLFVAIFFASCDQKVQYNKLLGETMGTYYAITYEKKNQLNTKKEIEKILLDFNNSVSTYVKESTISKLNRSKQGITLPENDLYFRIVFEKANQLHTLTDGDLNTAIAPLVNYWGFGYKGKEQVTQVDSVAVDSILSIVKQSTFELVRKDGNDYISKSISSAEIDFSSLAKGYGIDVIAEYLMKNNVENFLIDIGGEARAKGVNNLGKIWSLAINKPKDDAPIDDLEIILNLKDQSLATSGNYRIFYENGGRKFAHILNPKTGYSALSNLLSASIIADDCMTADGLATAMMVKGLEGAKEFLNVNKFPACLIYDADGDDKLEKYYANGFKEMIIKEK